MELKLTYVEDDATKNKRKVEKVLITIILTVITALCLLPGLMLLINATRANTQLQSGFSLLPGASFFKNLYGAFHDSSIDIGKGLLNSLPTQKNKKLYTIEGQPPSIYQEIQGCKFNPRCNFATQNCKENIPNLIEYNQNHFCACFEI